MTSGTRPERVKFFTDLRRVSKTGLTDSQEAPERFRSTSRDRPGTILRRSSIDFGVHFWDANFHKNISKCYNTIAKNVTLISPMPSALNAHCVTSLPSEAPVRSCGGAPPLAAFSVVVCMVHFFGVCFIKFNGAVAVRAGVRKPFRCVLLPLPVWQSF